MPLNIRQLAVNLFTTTVLTLCCGLIAAEIVQASTLTVTSGADSGAGTLRDTIAAASNGDTIEFDPSVTSIVLTEPDFWLFLGSETSAVKQPPKVVMQDLTPNCKSKLGRL